MNDYPPGVTGNEPEIAGYPERDAVRQVECDNDDCHMFEVPVDVEGTDILLRQSRYEVEIEFVWECETCHTEQSAEILLTGDY